ncbi:hypothetical protein OH781_33510 [Streptomyces sp. NBC_01550]|uniref:hypothetical protein n=1 Tax=Streptomyces sp. NBC_01550 TaxID=2975875 RepID=UPI00386BF83C
MRAHPAWFPVRGRAQRPGRYAVALLTGALLLSTAHSAPAAPASAAVGDAARTGPVAKGDAGTWVGTWATTPTAVPASDTTVFDNQTIRQTVHTSIGGNRVRIRLSNEFGDRPLVIGEARVARPAHGGPASRTDPSTDRPLTFGGRSSVTIPAGAPAVSDPVSLRLPAGSDLVVSIHLPERTPGSTVTRSPSSTITSRPATSPGGPVSRRPPPSTAGTS